MQQQLRFADRLPDPSLEFGTANLLLGIAYFNEGKLVSARTWFERAQRYEKQRRSARQWLRHVSQELAG